MALLHFVPANQLNVDQKVRYKELQKECFSSVNQAEAEKCFFAEPFGFLFASEDGMTVGQSELFIRKVSFEDRQVLLGGIGGVCVTGSMRNKGVGTQMVQRCVEILTEKRCEVACLNADIKGHPYGLYHRLGFKVMERKVSFEDIDGRVRYDGSEMFLPLCSSETFDLIMKSDTTFHMGKGYW
jgi:predicted N-acetyltransferase YhbS